MNQFSYLKQFKVNVLQKLQQNKKVIQIQKSNRAGDQIILFILNIFIYLYQIPSKNLNSHFECPPKTERRPLLQIHIFITFYMYL